METSGPGGVMRAEVGGVGSPRKEQPDNRKQEAGNRKPRIRIFGFLFPASCFLFPACCLFVDLPLYSPALRRLLSTAVFLLATQAAAQTHPPPDAAVFPIPGETRATVEFDEGHFRAFRPGRRPQRGCGRGHCGIDLSAPDGTPVLAVREGIVGQIERGDRDRAGRWVRIHHADGTTTWYMHLARVREGLAAGQSVAAGELLGTLGRTGVTSSPTHLHFALSVGPPRSPRYLDPEPLLRTASLLAEAQAPSREIAPSASDPSLAATASSPPDL